MKKKQQRPVSGRFGLYTSSDSVQKHACEREKSISSCVRCEDRKLCESLHVCSLPTLLERSEISSQSLLQRLGCARRQSVVNSPTSNRHHGALGQGKDNVNLVVVGATGTPGPRHAEFSTAHRETHGTDCNYPTKPVSTLQNFPTSLASTDASQATHSWHELRRAVVAINQHSNHGREEYSCRSATARRAETRVECHTQEVMLGRMGSFQRESESTVTHLTMHVREKPSPSEDSCVCCNGRRSVSDEDIPEVSHRDEKKDNFSSEVPRNPETWIQAICAKPYQRTKQRSALSNSGCLDATSGPLGISSSDLRCNKSTYRTRCQERHETSQREHYDEQEVSSAHSYEAFHGKRGDTSAFNVEEDIEALRDDMNNSGGNTSLEYQFCPYDSDVASSSLARRMQDGPFEWRSMCSPKTIFAGRGWISPHPLSDAPTDRTSSVQTAIQLPSTRTRQSRRLTFDEWKEMRRDYRSDCGNMP